MVLFYVFPPCPACFRIAHGNLSPPHYTALHTTPYSTRIPSRLQLWLHLILVDAILDCLGNNLATLDAEALNEWHFCITTLRNGEDQ